MKGLFIVFLILGIWFISGVNGESFEDLVWEHISREIVEVNVVWVDSQNPRIILAGTNRGVFKTEDGGNSWQAVLFGTNKRVNFLYVDQINPIRNFAQGKGNSKSGISNGVNKNLIYAACSSGLFFSRNQGRTWQRIYQGDSKQEANCLSLVKLKDKEVYLGTEAGLFKTQDNGRTWHRFSGSLGSLPIRAIAADQINKLIYLATSGGAYRIEPQAGAKRILVFQSVDLEESDIESADSQFGEEPRHQINYICIDPNKPQDIYLATTRGVFKSDDQGKTWRKLSDFGLLSRQVRFIAVSAGSILWAVTKSGVFAYNKDRWEELSLRLTMQDIRFLTVDHSGNIYVAGDKGLFRSADYHKVICPVRNQISNGVYPPVGLAQEPTIQQVHQAAIKYAQVIDPEQIAAQRRLARFKAILPDLSLDYDKTISTYNNSKFARFAVGPRDWGISLKWSLGDLIWSEQQRLIDSQVRLMIKLRQDILDEVTRLYFERRRLQLEFTSFWELKPKQRKEKELRIQELTALLNGLTGGYLSREISE